MTSKFKEIASTENGVLARLWRNMLLNNNLITALGWLVANYVKNGKKPTTTIMNLATGGELTWEAFNFLILDILKPTSSELILKVKIETENEEKEIKEILANISIEKKEKQNYLLADLRDKIINELDLDKEDIYENYKKRKNISKNPSTVKTILYTKNLTWKSFIFILLEVLKVKEIEITFRLKWKKDIVLQETVLLEGVEK